MLQTPAIRKLIAVALLAATSITAGAQSVATLGESTAAVAPLSAREAARRGEEFRRRWELDLAEAAFRQAAALDSASFDAVMGLARISQARLDWAGAKQFFDRARELRPESAEALAACGWLYLAAEDAGRALHYIESALKLDPFSAEAQTGRAGVDLLERDFRSAESRLRQIISRTPQLARARSMLGRALLEENKSAEAGAEAERAIALDPFDADALHTLAFVKATEGRADEVRSLARRALALDPMNVGARRLLSQYLNGRAGYDQKVSEEARRRYDRGVALKQSGRLREAAEEFESALRIYPRYYRALIVFGDLRLREENYELAVALARRAVEVDSDGALAHLELSYALWGLQERARRDLGATDFAALFYSKTEPAIFDLTGEIFPDYSLLARRQQIVIDAAVAPLSAYLPALARLNARHYLIGFDQRVSDLGGFDDVINERTLDGRFYASLRGVGGRVAVSGIEHLDVAARGGFHAIAHEFAHQVHMTAMSREETRLIRKLYEQARRESRSLDYYAASNEYEYFAQGYEAFVSERKRPSAGVTARHTRGELLARDPELYRFLIKLTGQRSKTTAGK
jgi:tetratricopeptide (TPR) repeat protein